MAESKKTGGDKSGGGKDAKSTANAKDLAKEKGKQINFSRSDESTKHRIVEVSDTHKPPPKKG